MHPTDEPAPGAAELFIAIVSVVVWSVIIGGLIFALWGCSSAPKGPRIVECLIGPDPKQDPVCDGEIVPWGTVEFPGADPTRYVCHRLDDHEAYRARCQP